MVGVERLSRRGVLGTPKSCSQPPWRSCFDVTAASCWSAHPHPFSPLPCREKASWALSFHPCQPPPAPLLNEGHFKLLLPPFLSAVIAAGPGPLVPCCSATLCGWEGPTAPQPNHPSCPEEQSSHQPALPCPTPPILYGNQPQPIHRDKKLTESCLCPCQPIPAT